MRYLVLFFVACGCGDTESANQKQNSFSGSCCLDGAAYKCPTEQAYTACAGFDAAMCHANCGADLACHMNCDQIAQSSGHDPSQCSRDQSNDSRCTSATPSCNDDLTAPSCARDADCLTGNCTHGRCAGNGVGNPCEADLQCASGNCTHGCCQGTSSGSPCSANFQCTSGQCSGGTCD